MGTATGTVSGGRAERVSRPAAFKGIAKIFLSPWNRDAFYFPPNGWGRVTKEDLVELIRRILRTDQKLDFLAKLEPGELRALAACIRNGLEPKKK